MSLLMRYFGWPYRAMPQEVMRWIETSSPLFSWASAHTAFPPANVQEDDDAVVMEFEVPGIARENIELTTTDTSVTIKVTRPVEGDIPPEKYHVRERWRGEFGRAVTIPAKVDSARAKASCRNGVLRVTIPKREEARSKTIEIQTD